jgi:hypothetical protein
MLRNESHRFEKIDWQKMMKELIRISDLNAIALDCKWVAEYLNSIGDKTWIHTLAGEL